MKRTYNSLVRLLEGSIKNLHKLKMIYAEHIALYKKRSLINEIKWSLEQQKEFDEYWKENYGKRITSKGHKLYESINGVYDKEYFPDFLFATKLEPKLNNLLYSNIYSDKSLTELLYSKSRDLIVPETYFVNIEGLWFDKKRNIVSYKDVIIHLNEMDSYILKPTIGGNSGKGITFVDKILDKQKIENILSTYGMNFIIQEVMSQHIAFDNLYSDSINTIRIITYSAKDKVFTAPIVIRIGQGGKKVDNIHAGGIAVGVTDEGFLLDEGYILGYSDSRNIVYEHPDTKVEFKNYHLPAIDKIITLSKELHGYTPHIGMISWDFMVNKEGKPVLIEANYMGQSIWFPQITHKKPLFGDNTIYMINRIK